MVARPALWHRRFVGVGAVLLLLQGCSTSDGGVSISVSLPPLLAVNAWDGMPVETFCLEGSETYEQVPSSTAPFADAIESILTQGYRGSGPNRPIVAPARLVEASCDFTITIAIEGRALQGTT
jgi:hypothetical protein